MIVPVTPVPVELINSPQVELLHNVIEAVLSLLTFTVADPPVLMSFAIIEISS